MKFRSFTVLAVILLTAPLCFATPVISLNFTALAQSQEKGILGTIYIPPDTDGAVGPNHVMVSTNLLLTVYDKVGNQVVGWPKSENSFWGAVSGISLPSTGNPAGDMRVMYDPGSGRWFASVFTGQSSGNNILIARSDTSDPTGTWRGASFQMNANRFADYPTMGIDANGVYIGTNNFVPNDGFSGVSLVSIPKADLLGASPTVANRSLLLDDNASGGFGTTLQGVYQGNGAPGLVLGVQNGGNLKLTQVNNPGAPGATLGTTTTITPGTALAGPVTATQPGAVPSGIEVGDNRLSAEVQQVGNKIFGVNVTNVGGHDALEWYVLDTSGNLLSNGTIGDPNHDYYYPSIAANSNGDVVINYNRSGATENVTDYVAVGSLIGNTLTFGTTLLVQQSPINNYFQDFGGGRNRWGDYSAAWLDPSDPTSFWVVSEWAQFFDWTTQGFSGLTPNEWMIQVAKITIPQAGGGVPEPATFGMVVVAGLALAWNYRRKRA